MSYATIAGARRWKTKSAICENVTMRNPVRIALLMLVAASGLSAATPASARGAAQNIMNSPGYQRALEESRKRQAEPYVKKPAVYPRKTWRHRGQGH